MASDSSGKICVACGTDCAGRPRVKDPRGRYYCEPCYDKRRSSQQVSAAGASPGLALEPEPSILDELLGAQAGAEPGGSCPNCGQELPGGAVLCVNCGFNLRDGSAVPQIVQTQATSRARSGDSAWPIVVGVISIVLAAGGILNFGFSFIDGLSGNIGRSIGSMVPMVIAIWLLISGVGVLRRQRSGAANLRNWAIVKLLFSFICIGVISVGASLSLEGLLEGMEMEGISIPPGLAYALIFAYLLWLISWPVFVLIWLSRPSVKAEVATWH
jgi:hypothetical protein